MNPIALTIMICFGAARCSISRAVFLPSFTACAERAATMVHHARKVTRGMVVMQCKAIGER